jgi:hypothetical protein
MKSIEKLRIETATASLKAGGREKYAAQLGVPTCILRDFLNGQRKPSKTLLAALGYEKVTMYANKAARQEAGLTKGNSTNEQETNQCQE